MTVFGYRFLRSTRGIHCAPAKSSTVSRRAATAMKLRANTDGAALSASKCQCLMCSGACQCQTPGLECSSVDGVAARGDDQVSGENPMSGVSIDPKPYYPDVAEAVGKLTEHDLRAARGITHKRSRRCYSWLRQPRASHERKDPCRARVSLWDRRVARCAEQWRPAI